MVKLLYSLKYKTLKTMKQFFGQNVPRLDQSIARGFAVFGTGGLAVTIEANEKTYQNQKSVSLPAASSNIVKAIGWKDILGNYYTVAVGGESLILYQTMDAGSTEASTITKQTVIPSKGGKYWYCAGVNPITQDVVIGGNTGSLCYTTIGFNSFSRGSVGSSAINGIAFNQSGVGVLVGDNGTLYYCNKNNVGIWNVAMMRDDFPGNVNWYDVISTGIAFYALGYYSNYYYLGFSANGSQWNYGRFRSARPISRLVYSPNAPRGDKELWGWYNMYRYNNSNAFVGMYQSRYIVKIDFSTLTMSSTPGDTIGISTFGMPMNYTIGDIRWDTEENLWYYTEVSTFGTQNQIRIKKISDLSEIPTGKNSIGMGGSLVLSGNGGESQNTGLIVYPTSNWAPEM